MRGNTNFRMEYRLTPLTVWFKHTAVLIAGLTLAMVSGAAAAQEATEDSDAQAFLVTPLSFVKQFDLDYGTIIPGNTPGTVTMDSAGTVTTTGGVLQVDGTQTPALFWGFGAFLQTVLINSDSNTYVLTREGGTETMLMDQVLIGSQPPIIINTNPRRFRIVNPDGYFSFTIAGRLQVGANLPPGTYAGEFTIQLEYE
ncbi:DUF4402 domain-containing protein [Erythrobacter sp. Alg231-14]|uniref:DUF4402 domain-containing protein n=1 Tax=Erythrobacter sp. Alg231-14 TaxID=1922225 RepID=UPI000D550143